MDLLDSAAFYWVLTDPTRFGPHTTARITSGELSLVSSISILELTIKQLKGNLPKLDFVAGAGAANLRLVSYDPASAAALGAFPELVGHDPFDRALVAQAYAGGYNFYTSDRKLLSLGRGWIRDLGE